MRFAIIWKWVPGGKPDIDFRAGGYLVLVKINTATTMQAMDSPTMAILVGMLTLIVSFCSISDTLPTRD